MLIDSAVGRSLKSKISKKSEETELPWLLGRDPRQNVEIETPDQNPDEKTEQGEDDSG